MTSFAALFRWFRVNSFGKNLLTDCGEDGERVHERRSEGPDADAGLGAGVALVDVDDDVVLELLDQLVGTSSPVLIKNHIRVERDIPQRFGESVEHKFLKNMQKANFFVHTFSSSPVQPLPLSFETRLPVRRK